MQTKFSEYKEIYQTLRERQQFINKGHYLVRCTITDDFVNKKGENIPKIQLRFGSQKHAELAEIYFSNNHEAQIYLRTILEDYTEKMFSDEEIDMNEFNGAIKSKTQNLELALGTLRDYEEYEQILKEIFENHNNSFQKPKTKII